ncbi:TPA: hypothetical protein R4Z75_001489 [Citrobacter freundii]|uniref:hypothetical protein n=1 Tax=Citrobacter freundii TaxID=546 RepID=UPI0025CAF72A|nr:hypothetical protein [Citrobacter freundii]MBJ9083936.1 hypothetical protein [Citrobacter freundii]MDN4230767.1 hypothetical protein [Citrobacter freundii]MDT7314195.1 hypothetical protein [Citrobacter freundii]HED2995399.1 hypothetical protein [Citrobacter freundii]
MADSSWVDVGGFIASACSALAAYLAIRQTINQRKISIKPQLIINNFEIRENKLSKNNYTASPLANVDTSHLGPTIINAGLGSALNVMVEWSYPQEDKLIWLKDNLIKISKNFSINYIVSKNSKFESYNIIGGGSTTLAKIMRYDGFNYILPLSIEKKTECLKIPPLIVNTMLNEANFIMLTKGKISNGILGPTLRVVYHDVEGKAFSIKYESRFIVKEIIANIHHNNYIGSLCFEVVNQKRTPHVLKRIRKSYADFISEHDFNKNK